jgi:hypothetical protein
MPIRVISTATPLLTMSWFGGITTLWAAISDGTARTRVFSAFSMPT